MASHVKEIVDYMTELGLNPQLIRFRKSYTYRVTLPDGSNQNVSVPISPSDKRAMMNQKCRLRRIIKACII